MWSIEHGSREWSVDRAWRTRSLVRRRRSAAGTLVLGLLAVAASLPAQGNASPSSPDSLRVPILVYHSVAPHHPGQTPEQRELDVDTAVFRQQMRYLAEHRCNVIPLTTLVDALNGHRTVPEHAVVITFDDGWENQYHYAYPVLRQLGLTATFFVYPKPIGHEPLWMSWEQLREMRDAGMTIGSHSLTHPVLTAADVNLHDEIETSREDIQQNLGTAPELFAYPYGVWNGRAADAVRAAGYRAARAFPGGPWNSAADMYALHAVLVTDDMEAFEREVGRP